MFACLCQMFHASPDEVDAETRDNGTCLWGFGPSQRRANQQGPLIGPVGPISEWRQRPDAGNAGLTLSWLGLVVLVVEVRGCWLHETQNFLSQLAKAKARAKPS